MDVAAEGKRIEKKILLSAWKGKTLEIPQEINTQNIKKHCVHSKSRWFFLPLPFPKKGPLKNDSSSSNHQFSANTFVFLGSISSSIFPPFQGYPSPLPRPEGREARAQMEARSQWGNLSGRDWWLVVSWWCHGKTSTKWMDHTNFYGPNFFKMDSFDFF